VATPEAFEKAVADSAELAKNYDAIWLGEGDYKKATSLADRLGSKNLGVLAQAVAAGVGLGVWRVVGEATPTPAWKALR
jgi:hypothetical protein